MSNFIPGKWICKDGYIFAETGETIASVFNPTDMDTNEANARLIAAAPDMYEALHVLLSYVYEAEGLAKSSCYKAKAKNDIAQVEALLAHIDGKEGEH